MEGRISIAQSLLFVIALVAALFTAERAEGYTVLGVRWPGSHPRVPFYVSTSCDGHAPYNGPFEDGIRAITYSANVWNTEGASNFKFVYAGVTTVSNAANDGINAIIWSPQRCPYPDTGCAAECIIWEEDNIVVGFDVILYAERASDGLPLRWSARTIVLASEMSMWAVILHEFGHALGLGHSDTQAVMSTGCGPGCNHLNLAIDDENGIQFLYGPYTNEGLWASNPTPAPGETVTLFLDYPRAAGQRFQVVADFDGLATGCALRQRWPADSRIFPLDRRPYPLGSRSPTPLEAMALPANTGVLDANGQAQVTVQVQGAVPCGPTNRTWHFAVVTYDPNLSPSGIEDVGVVVALDIQAPPGPELRVRRPGPGLAELRWEARANYASQLERSTTLADWTALDPLRFAPAGGGWLTGAVSMAESSEFFRVRALAPANPPCDGGLLSILISTNYLRITSVSKSFTVWLNGPPSADVTVTTTRTSGESVFVVSAGASHAFDAWNWNVPHTVTITQRADATSSNMATFTVSGAGLSNAVVTVQGRLRQ